VLYNLSARVLIAKVAFGFHALLRPDSFDITYLDEADVVASLPEALTADVEAVLADETSWVSADAAVKL